MNIKKSITDLIGSTPLLELTNYNKSNNLHGTILAKLEYFNPAGSAKDRIAKSMIENDLTIDEHVKNSCEKIKEYYKENEELEHFKRIFEDDWSGEIRSGGYVIDSLESTIYCLKNTGSYEEAVLKAVNLGGDTDTTAAICGGLAGIYYGFDAIPIDWINSIKYIDRVISLCERFEAYCDEN